MSHDEPERCHKERAKDAPPLFQNGNVNFQVYHIGWIISGAFALVAVVASFWLIDKHLQWYTNKREQRYIVRLLFLVPIYAIISFASFIFWNHATPLILVRDAYEAIVLTAFFYLLLMYISHDPEEQRKVFLKKGLSREADITAKRKGLKVQKWMWPLGFVKWKPKDGLYFLQLMKWGVLQYCVIRPTTTLAAVILEYMGLYCETSWGLGWGHIWIMLIISISVTIAMYCLIQLYMPVSEDLARHKPLLKLFAIKAVVFLTFWQATFLSILSMAGLIKDTQFMTAEDINIGIGALLEDFEMMLFAFLHIRAFTYKVYRPAEDDNGLPPERTPRWRSLGHAMDFRETFREIWVGCVYMFDKMRGKEPKQDHSVRRAAHYERAFGRERVLPAKPSVPNIAGDSNPEKTADREPAVKVAVRRELDIEGERQWLGAGKYGYFGPRRERSEGLQDQIDRELEKLGHPTTKERPRHAPTQHERVSTSTVPWWRSLYNRISQHAQDPEPDDPNSVDHPYTGLLPRQDQRRRRSQSSSLVPKANRQRTPSGSRPEQQRRSQHRANDTSPVPGPSRARNQRDQGFSRDNGNYSLLQMNERLPSPPRRNQFDDATSRYPAFGIVHNQPNPVPQAHGAPPSSYQKVQEWRNYHDHPQPRALSNSSQWGVPPRLAGTTQAQQLRASDVRLSPPTSPSLSPLSPSKALPSLPPTRPHPRMPEPQYAHQPAQDASDEAHIRGGSVAMPIPHLFASPIPKRLHSPVSSPSSTPPLSPPLPPLSPFEPRLNTSYVPGPTYVPAPSVSGGGHMAEGAMLGATASSPSFLSPGVAENPARQRSTRVLIEMPASMVVPSDAGGVEGGNFDTRSSSHRREPAVAVTTVFPNRR